MDESLNINHIIANTIKFNKRHLLIVTDDKGNIIDASQNIADYTQIKYAKLASKNIFELCKNIGYPLPFNSFKNLFDNFPQNLNYKIQNSLFKLDVLPHTLNNNKTIYILFGANINQTTSVNSSAEFLNKIIDNLPQYIFWKDCNSVFLGCNANFASLVGLKNKKDIIGKTDYDFSWSPEETKKYITDDQKIISRKEPELFYEETQKQLDGKEHNVLVSKIPMVDNQDKIQGIICIYQDITAFKQLQEELKKAEIKKRLQQEKIDSMRTISGAIAHELRNPLCKIGVVADLMKRIMPDVSKTVTMAKEANLPIPLTEQKNFALLEEGLDDIHDAVSYTHSFINMLLMNLSKIKLQEKDIKECSMVECVKQALKRYPFDDQFGDERGLIKWDDKQADFIFKGAELLVVHILFNLIKNALYFIADANKGDVTIWLEQHDNCNELHVKDTAKGIPENVLPNIFKAFYTEGCMHGTGVGLSFCQMAAKALDGEITCQSTLGEFTEFIIKLPKV